MLVQVEEQAGMIISMIVARVDVVEDARLLRECSRSAREPEPCLGERKLPCPSSLPVEPRWALADEREHEDGQHC